VTTNLKSQYFVIPVLSQQTACVANSAISIYFYPSGWRHLGLQLSCWNSSCVHPEFRSRERVSQTWSRWEVTFLCCCVTSAMPMTHASPHKTWTVFKQFGRSLISLSLSAGSLLLDSLKEHISTTAQDHCKAIYLHVLTTNNTAIHFYENRDFKQHHYLPYYYSIRGVLKDGFTYVLYINGGHPPWTILYPFLYLTYLFCCVA